MKLSIIVPVYNEEKTIEKVLKELRKLKINKEIIVVDDGSRDKTPEILKKIKGIKVVTHRVNKGKGEAVITGINHARGEVIIIQDADLEYKPKDIPKLLKAMEIFDADAVYGYRFMKRSGKKLLFHDFGNIFLSFVTSLLFLSSIPDMETGYKLIKRKVLKGICLKAKRFEIEPEITAKLLKNGCKIIFIPIEFEARGFEEGKKIRIWDGVIALFTLLKFRISSRL